MERQFPQWARLAFEAERADEAERRMDIGDDEPLAARDGATRQAIAAVFNAVIDFGGLGRGDPAWDLTIAYTLMAAVNARVAAQTARQINEALVG